MDTLALLCTLHADGPASIQRLRAADLSSIDDVLGCSVETTAEVLGLSMAQGRRFHREARMLTMRTQGEGLDREESMYPGGVMAELTAAQNVMKGVAATRDSAEPVRSISKPAESQETKPDIAAILAPVLDRWEKEEASEGAAQQQTTAEESGVEETKVSTPSTSAPVASLDGVDGELSMALVAAGYGTLDAVVEVEPLALSRAIGRPYSEACRVNFLAKRALAASPAVSAVTPSTPSEEGVPSPHGSAAGSEGPGGPFA